MGDAVLAPMEFEARIRALSQDSYQYEYHYSVEVTNLSNTAVLASLYTQHRCKSLPPTLVPCGEFNVRMEPGTTRLFGVPDRKWLDWGGPMRVMKHIQGGGKHGEQMTLSIQEENSSTTLTDLVLPETQCTVRRGPSGLALECTPRDILIALDSSRPLFSAWEQQMSVQLQSGIRRSTLVRLVNKGPEHLIWAHLRPPEESAGPDPVGFCGLPLIQNEPYTVMIPADWSYVDRSIRAKGATFWESAVMRTFVLGTADVGSVLFKFLNGRVHLLEQISSFLFEVVDASAGPLRLAVYTDQSQQDMPETVICPDAMDYGVEISIAITDLGAEVECDVLGVRRGRAE